MPSQPHPSPPCSRIEGQSPDFVFSCWILHKTYIAPFNLYFKVKDLESTIDIFVRILTFELSCPLFLLDYNFISFMAISGTIGIYSCTDRFLLWSPPPICLFLLQSYRLRRHLLLIRKDADCTLCHKCKTVFWKYNIPTDHNFKSK